MPKATDSSESALRLFLNEIESNLDTAIDPAELGDICAVAKKIDGTVEGFLIEQNLTSGTRQRPGQPLAANENLDGAAVNTRIGIEGLSKLVEACGVARQHRRAAIEQIAIILHRHLGYTHGSAWSNQFISAESFANGQNNSRPLNSVYSDAVAADLLASPKSGMEAFGVDTQGTLPDMKLAITVTLMKFHTSLIPRVLAVRGIDQPHIQYVKHNLEVFDLADYDGPIKKLIDLYEDPSTARNVLQKIVPLVANDADGVLVDDGVVKFGKNVNIMKLSIDADKFGHDRINRTDIIADNVLIEKVYLTLTKGSDSEQFEILIPAVSGRLTRPSNAIDSAIRNADIQYSSFLTKSSKTTAGALTTLLADAESELEGIAVTFILKPSVNLKSGQLDALGSVSLRAHHTVNQDLLSAGLSAAVAGMVPDILGYSMDARFSEENIRKSNIAIRSHRQPFSYDIPTGRNYVYDYPIGVASTEEHAANLSKVIRIGQDDRALRIITDTLEHVYNQVRLFNSGNPMDKFRDPGLDYVAGAQVRPYVIMGTLGLAGLTGVRDADRPGDIKQRTITYLTAIIAEIHNRSFFTQQVAGSEQNVTYKMITSNLILGNVVGAPHIHNHLNPAGEKGKTDDTEYTLVLPNGVKIECVTTTFAYMRDKIIVIPTIPGNPESELNFAHNWDYGTMVAHYTVAGDASHHRVFANLRELPLPTNPIGAIIDVTGLDSVTYRD